MEHLIGIFVLFIGAALSFAFTVITRCVSCGGRIGGIPSVHVSQLRNSIKIRKNGGNKKRWSRFQYFCKFLALFISFTILSQGIIPLPPLFITYYIKLLSWIQYQFTFGSADERKGWFWMNWDQLRSGADGGSWWTGQYPAPDMSWLRLYPNSITVLYCIGWGDG